MTFEIKKKVHALKALRGALAIALQEAPDDLARLRRLVDALLPEAVEAEEVRRG